MNAFHVNWTKPFFLRNRSLQYFIEDYDLLTTILSALEWRKHNGNIKMVTDSVGAEYYQKMGLSHIWNLGIEISLDSISKDVSPLPFWAAGKIFALKKQDIPCIMLDTDFIVWKHIIKKLINEQLVVAHRENISAEIYPDKMFFIMKEKYKFPEIWDWSILPCNTAFLYISNKSLKDYYTLESINFMQNLLFSKNITSEMVFAEQRILAMCAIAKNVNIKSLLDLNKMNSQNAFTHIWGYKKELQLNKEKRYLFCLDCIKRIYNEFSDELANLEKIESLNQLVKTVL